MRMRRKRNLEPRMQACADILLVRGRPMLNLKEAAERYRALLCLEKVFGNKNPVELEVGCGNGGFVLEKAKRNQSVNYLALELSTNVILTAMERAKEEGVTNVRYLNIPAEILPCYLEEGSVRKIYLNFSTPLPETSREKQRLTASRFLQIYRALLIDGGVIEQKTDSEPFFEYSLEKFVENGFTVTDITRDLHHSTYALDNIVTEYEHNFASKGMPIYRAVAIKQ
ncbi:MAG: tRNA (guanosine(46)-N7)-methyltransferase TrmB [Clostridia bacterium]|nr:tRNA (guanosine(46)-N7)-methyltransferase TrmB [Clostridia bacterium]